MIKRSHILAFACCRAVFCVVWLRVCPPCDSIPRASLSVCRFHFLKRKPMTLCVLVCGLQAQVEVSVTEDPAVVAARAMSLDVCVAVCAAFI
jgi:hypothetical protein